VKILKIVLKNIKKMSKPKLEDYYDIQDPRGCSTTEYNEYLKALDKYNKNE